MQQVRRSILLTLSSFILVGSAKAQCVSINNLPDTIKACKNSTVQLDAQVTSAGLLNPVDTTWSPATGLNNPNIINPVATIGATSALYTLTIKALTPFNFVDNGDFSSGKTGFTSGYIVGPGGAWGPLSNEGTYEVTTDPSLVHTNFASFGDHTTGTGQMMVVNGSATANVSVWCQTIPVIPNTTYDFSAWAASCVVSNPAVLQFSINGTLLGAPFGLSATTGLWQQFHTTWFSGANTSATICITNQNTLPSGNDFAIDDIEFREICEVSDSVFIKVANMVPSIDNTVMLGCIEDSVQFNAIDNGDIADEYLWDFGDGNGSTLKDPLHIYTTQGNYTVKLVTKKDGCADSAFIVVNTVHVLSIDFTMSDDSVCIGESIDFTSTASGTFPVLHFWDFGDSTTSNDQAPRHTYKEPGVYTVMHVVHDIVPCYDTIYKDVYVSVEPVVNVVLEDSVICEGQTIRVQAYMDNGYNGFSWDFGGYMYYDEPDVNFAYDTSGDFTVRLFVDYKLCPDVTIDRQVKVHPTPTVNLGRDTTICPYGAGLTLFDPNYRTDYTYVWSTGETGQFITVRHPGIYWMTATHPAGCTASDSIEILKDCYLDIPNSFTPNGDGVNDYFLPRQLLSRGLEKFKMSIYNRWGQLIFETDRLNGRGWDGRFNEKEQPMDVYVYLIEATFKHGVSEKYQGNVTLVR